MKYQILKNTDKFNDLAGKDWIQKLASSFSENGVVNAEAIIDLEKIGMIKDAAVQKESLKNFLVKIQAKSVELKSGPKLEEKTISSEPKKTQNAKLKILF